jgi:hypothetical protein
MATNDFEFKNVKLEISHWKLVMRNWSWGIGMHKRKQCGTPVPDGVFRTGVIMLPDLIEN